MVRRAFNFLRAVSQLGAPRLSLAGREFAVHQAVEYAVGEELGEAFRISGDKLAVRLGDGVLRVLYLPL